MPEKTRLGRKLLWIATGAVLGLSIAFLWPSTSELAPARAVVGAAERLRAEEAWTVQVFEETAPSVAFIYSVTRIHGLFSLRTREVHQGSGSGFVWDKEGHVVTNWHVVRNADAVAVRLSGKEAYPAKVVGQAPRKDLAVLKIDAPRDLLIPVKIGNSKDLRVGMTALAIGNPFGLDHSLSKGVISALGREVVGAGDLTITDVIQTDAAINPGNSGGPLLNSRGELIGVNTQIATPSGGNAGVGFAIPVDTIKWVVGDILRYGKVIRAGLGIQPFPEGALQRWRARYANFPEGVPILSCTANSAAQRAGLEGATEKRDGTFEFGDFIVAIDDHKVTNHFSLHDALNRYRIGDTVKVTVTRDGRQRTVPVRLQAIR